MRIEKAIVSDANPDLPNDFDEFTVQTQRPFGVIYEGLQENLRIDDYLYLIEPDPAEDDLFTSLQGVLQYTFGNFKIAPRDAEDVQRSQVSRVSINTSFEPAVTIIAPGDAVLFTNDADTAIDSLSADGLFTVLGLGPESSFFYFFDDLGLVVVTNDTPNAAMNVIVQP